MGGDRPGGRGCGGGALPLAVLADVGAPGEGAPGGGVTSPPPSDAPAAARENDQLAGRASDGGALPLAASPDLGLPGGGARGGGAARPTAQDDGAAAWGGGRLGGRNGDGGALPLAVPADVGVPGGGAPGGTAARRTPQDNGAAARGGGRLGGGVGDGGALFSARPADVGEAGGAGLVDDTALAQAAANDNARPFGGERDNESSPDRLVAHLRRVVPLPFVRKVRLHMDSCPGTNKSQFFYGGIGLMLATGLLDCAMVVYMVVGHTKFGPDLVARQIAGRYNTQDTFNHGQLVEHISKYATSGAYDEKMLRTWKLGTQELFAPIAHIMSYRCMVLLADDGKIRLDPVAPPADFEPFPDGGNVFHDADLMRECEGVAERRLRTVVFPSLRRKTYRGVGERAVPHLSDAPVGSSLLPASVGSCRAVRLFTRRSVSDKFWREQARWMRDPSLQAVNAALAAVDQYASHPEMRKEAYGSKAKDISDQYAKFVPPEFVPDRYLLPDRGCTGTMTQTTLGTPGMQAAPRNATHTSGNNTGRTAAPVSAQSLQKCGKVRWSGAAHAQPLASALLAPPFNGVLPRKAADWETLVTEMPAPGSGLVWDVLTLKRHAKVLAKKRPDIAG